MNIHRFKVIARFGLMHVMATNICVWIRTLVLESLKEITAFYITRKDIPETSQIAEDLRVNTLKYAGLTMGVELAPAPPADVEMISEPSRSINFPGISAEDSNGKLMDRLVQATTQKIVTIATTFATPSTTRAPTTTIRMTTPTTTTESSNFFDSGLNSINSGFNSLKDKIVEVTTQANEDEVTKQGFFGNLMKDTAKSISDLRPDPTSNIDFDIPGFLPQAEAFKDLSTIPPFHLNATSCERVNIMGTIVQDATPYLYPFIIEYSLIGAAVIYVMWKHIGRYPKVPDEDLEHRLEVMLSRRAQALAQAKGGRVDCIGASKGLFFGLLMLVGLVISLILFFVLVKHNEFKLLSYYLADASHAGVMGFAILAILIGFCR